MFFPRGDYSEKDIRMGDILLSTQSSAECFISNKQKHHLSDNGHFSKY